MTWTARTLPTRPPAPVLAGVKIEATSDDEYRVLFRTNVDSAFFLCKLLLPWLEKGARSLDPEGLGMLAYGEVGDALAELGVIPKEAAAEIWAKGKWEVERIDEWVREAVAAEPGLSFAENLAALCTRLEGERVILLMLPAGAAVEEGPLRQRTALLAHPGAQLVTGAGVHVGGVGRPGHANRTMDPPPRTTESVITR